MSNFIDFTSHYVQITQKRKSALWTIRQLYIPLRSDNSVYYLNKKGADMVGFTSHYVQITRDQYSDAKSSIASIFTSHYVQITQEVTAENFISINMTLHPTTFR